MLVERQGYYESGAFDIRADAPRPTGLAHAIAVLAKHGSVDHPVLDRPGWWRADISEVRARPLLLVGFGRLISVIEQCCALRRLAVCTARPDKIQLLLAKHGAWAAIRVEDDGPRRAGAPALPVQISCRFPDGGNLLLQFDPARPLTEAANALLDLVIDGQRGGFELSRTASANQYELTPLSDHAQPGEQVRPELTSNVA